jgi:hypothetical protein
VIEIQDINITDWFRSHKSIIDAAQTSTIHSWRTPYGDNTTGAERPNTEAVQVHTDMHTSSGIVPTRAHQQGRSQRKRRLHNVHPGIQALQRGRMYRTKRIVPESCTRCTHKRAGISRNLHTKLSEMWTGKKPPNHPTKKSDIRSLAPRPLENHKSLYSN